ncbi:MAG: SAM-dependent chlorinase/fluorinase [Candidatus Sericytochromatia bacterium]|nr:SAM-dependent chlorinase/fluorinase [Candidatus Tanganyikabacteria bacterium]
MRPIALITDFQQSEYVGMLKGVLLRDAPGAQIVDLFHGVSPQGVREGAWVLAVSAGYFPEGTVFVGVVDPGVGGARRGVAIFTRRYAFVGPDNGLLHPAAVGDGLGRAVGLEIPPDASKTFHGRDVFAPVAARISRGEIVDGPAIADLVPLAFHLYGREGEVVRIDPFGNIITNLPPEPAKKTYRLTLGRLEATLPWVPTYAAAPEGELVVVTGSAGTLEIAMKEKSAEAKLAPDLGQRIILA